MMKKCFQKEQGAVIVEAAIVFPVMFLVLFALLFSANAFLQKCRVEAHVNKMAVYGAALCADPMLEQMSTGQIPGLKDINIRPYRYLIGGMDDVEEIVYQQTKTKLDEMGPGVFASMTPTDIQVETKFHNGFIYSTFAVHARYRIRLPIRLLGADDFIYIDLWSRSEMPVSDSTEFIRNIDMVEDYMQRTGATAELEEAIAKAQQWFKKD